MAATVHERMAVEANVSLLIVAFVASFGFLYWWKKQGNAKHRYPPAFPSLPIVGSLPFLRGLNNVAEYFLKSSQKLGPIFTFKVGSKNILVLNSKDSIEDACIHHANSFSGRSALYVDSLVNPHRKGLATISTGDEWKRLYQLSVSILKEFGFGVKNEMQERILIEVESMVEFLREKKGRSLAPRETIAMIATNVINNFMFGKRREYQDGIDELYIQVERIFQGLDLTLELSPAIRLLPRYREKIQMYKDSHGIVTTILRKEISRCKDLGATDCFVKRYLDKEGNELDEEQLLWSVRDMVGAGTDTTIATLLWSLVALADHPVVQDRLRSDIDAVVQRSRFPTMDDQRNLPYAEATILELMRWKTLAPLGVPRLTLKDVNVNGYFVPAGTMTMTNIYAAHMDRKAWDNPNEFRPERFLDKDNNVIGKDRIVSFGLGRRSCLGEVLARTEIFLVFTAIVQNFVILPPEGQDKVEAKPLEPIGLTMVPLPFNVRLVPRI